MKTRHGISSIAIVCLALSIGTACEAQETGAMVTREDADDPYFASVLFANNGMTIDESTVRRVLRDEIETVVWLNAMYKGLPVFFYQHGYSFDRNRKMETMPGTDEPMILGEPLPPASAFPAVLVPSIERNDAIAAWLEAVEREPMLGINAGNAGRQQVTLGFLNTNRNNAHAANFSLVWRVRSPNGAPVAMVDAESGDVLYFDSGIRSGRPVAPEAPPENSPRASNSDLAGTWLSGRCSDRKYRRELILSSDNSFTATDYVSPCPPGKTCVWSGIVNRSGTWSMQNLSFVELSPTSPEQRQGVPLARHLHYEGSSDSLLEATPGSVPDCVYHRSGSSKSGRGQ